MKNTGDGRRKVRVEKEVQELISNFIIRQLRNDLPGMVTVTRVQMPADFRTANVYLSYFEEYYFHKKNQKNKLRFQY